MLILTFLIHVKSSRLHAKCSEFGLMCFDPVYVLVFRSFVFCVHLLKLCSDLQRCLILDLWDVELDKQHTAHAEKQKYEEAEGMEMLLQRKEDSLSQSDAV